jgi:ketosteroid isomerase-like protein
MPDLTPEDRDRLRSMTENEWVTACVSRDWDKAVALCTEDVNYMPPDSPWLHGRAAVAEFLNGFPEMEQLFQHVVKMAGDTSLVVLHATFGGSFIVEGQKLTGEGKVLATAAKSDGAWRFSSVCFNWDAPPAPAD